MKQIKKTQINEEEMLVTPEELEIATTKTGNDRYVKIVTKGGDTICLTNPSLMTMQDPQGEIEPAHFISGMQVNKNFTEKTGDIIIANIQTCMIQKITFHQIYTDPRGKIFCDYATPAYKVNDFNTKALYVLEADMHMRKVTKSGTLEELKTQEDNR